MCDGGRPSQDEVGDGVTGVGGGVDPCRVGWVTGGWVRPSQGVVGDETGVMTLARWGV